MVTENNLTHDIIANKVSLINHTITDALHIANYPNKGNTLNTTDTLILQDYIWKLASLCTNLCTIRTLFVKLEYCINKQEALQYAYSDIYSSIINEKQVDTMFDSFRTIFCNLSDLMTKYIVKIRLVEYSIQELQCPKH